MKPFLSATALVWCGILLLAMIGFIYLIKLKNVKNKNNIVNKLFLILYFITFTLLIIEIILQTLFSLEANSIIVNIISKIYIFIGLLWNFSIVIYYVYLLISTKTPSKEEKIYKKMFIIASIIMAICAIIVIIFPIWWTYIDSGFWVLEGTLNSIYNKIALICDGILLLFILINRKYLPKELVLYSLGIFTLYMINFVLEDIYGYYAKDSVFLYTLFVTGLYFTTESQDKKMLDDYDNKKEHYIYLKNKKESIITDLNHEINTVLNTINLTSDSLLNEEYKKDNIFNNDMQRISTATNNLFDITNNILYLSEINKINSCTNEEYEINKLTNNLLKNNIDINIANNLLPKYKGDYKKIEKLLDLIIYDLQKKYTKIKMNIFGSLKDNKMKIVFCIETCDNNNSKNIFEEKQEEYTINNLIISKLVSLLDAETKKEKISLDNIKYTISIIQENC